MTSEAASARSARRPHFGLDVMRKGGTLIVVGLYGGALPFPLPFFPQRALGIRGSYVGTLDELREVIALGR